MKKVKNVLSTVTLFVVLSVVLAVANASETPLLDKEGAEEFAEIDDATHVTGRQCADGSTAWTESLVGSRQTNYVFSQNGENVLIIMNKQRNDMTLLSESTPYAWIMHADHVKDMPLNGANIHDIIITLIDEDAANCFASLFNPIN